MSERVEFKPPKGVVPEDVEKGDTFDLVSTYRLKDNGEICLIQIGDTKMPGYEEGEYESKEKTNRKSYGDVVDSMHAALGAEAEGGGNPGMAGGY